MSNGAPSSLPPAPDPARTIWRFVMTQNPFYLLSVCFVLHGTAFWFQQQGGEFSPWPLMGLICGYVALMAVTGVVMSFQCLMLRRFDTQLLASVIPHCDTAEPQVPAFAHRLQ